MLLSWRDGVTTILAFLTAGITYLMATGYSLPFHFGFRIGTLLLLVIGIGMCALGASPTSNKGLFTSAIGVLGILVSVLILLALITGSKITFISVGAMIVLMYLLTTYRHITSF